MKEMKNLKALLPEGKGFPRFCGSVEGQPYKFPATALLVVPSEMAQEVRILCYATGWDFTKERVSDGLPEVEGRLSETTWFRVLAAREADGEVYLFTEEDSLTEPQRSALVSFCEVKAAAA